MTYADSSLTALAAYMETGSKQAYENWQTAIREAKGRDYCTVTNGSEGTLRLEWLHRNGKPFLRVHVRTGQTETTMDLDVDDAWHMSGWLEYHMANP